MADFEFEVLQNFGIDYGNMQGYIATGGEIAAEMGSRIMRCSGAIHDAIDPVSDKLIPIIHDEYALADTMQTNFFPIYGSEMAGLVTFGASKDAYAYRKPQESHLAVILREIALPPNFLMPMLKIPGRMSNDYWLLESPLVPYHLHFGRVSVRGNTCIISVDETVPPLKDPYDD